MADAPSFRDRDEVGALEKARERLYAPGVRPQDVFHTLSDSEEPTAPHGWGDNPPVFMSKAHPHVRLATIFFFGALIFFVVAAATAVYLIYFGVGSVSTNNITLAIQGPTTAAGGDTVPLSLTITNKNPTQIENGTIEVDFPSGTRSASDITQDYPRYTENLGTLAPGQTVTRSVQAVLFGAQGQDVSLPISFSYSTGGSNAVFVKRTTYDLSISSAPLSVSVVAPTEAVAGQPFSITLSARSNATTPISNVVLTGEYPFGFSTASSTGGQTGTFVIGTLAPGDTRSFTVTGTFSGAGNDQRVFHFNIGTAQSSNTPTLSVVYMSQEADVTLAAPFINTAVSINGNSGANLVLSPGARATATVTYANTISTTISGAQVEVQVTGSGVDYSSIQTTTGFYRSSDHTIVFDSSTDPSLASLQPGVSGLGTFSFATLPAGTGGSSQVSFIVSVSGTRVDQQNVPQHISGSTVQTAKIASSLMFSAQATHASGPFGNQGSLPPTANTPTQYTVLWNVRNGSNAVTNATVTATLPSYVTTTGNVSGSVTYDPSSRTVTWALGDLGAGASAQAAFQISFTPSTSQRGTAPALTNTASLSAFDRFAQVQVGAQADPVTIATPSDPGYVAADGSVK